MIDINPTTGYSKMYDFIGNKVVNGGSFVVLLVFTFIIIVYYSIFSFIGRNDSEIQVQSTGVKFIEIIMWGLFIFLILINGLQYFLNINIKAGIKNIFNNKPELDFVINKKPNNRKSNSRKKNSDNT